MVEAGLSSRTILRRYGLAVLCAAGAVLLRWLLDPLLEDNLPMSTAFGFVALAVWYGGWGPASLTAALCYLAQTWLFIDPRFSLSIDPGQLWPVISYLLGVFAIIAVGETLRRTQQRAASSARVALERLWQLESEIEERKRVEAALRCSEETLSHDVSERRHAEKALRESEARHRDLVRALPAAVYTCDGQGRITMYNHAAAGLWGREPEIGKDLWCGSWKIYRPNGDPLPLEECPMAVTLRAGRPVRGQEMIIERPNGSRRHVLPHPEPLYDSAGNLIGAVNMLIDITGRKHAERAMGHLAAIVTSSDAAIVSKDLRGTVTSWNRAAERLFGYSAEEMIGRSILRLIPLERRDEETRILDQIIRGQAIEPYETVRHRKDGSEVTISLTVSPIIDAQGNVIGASKIARDISEQKEAERALLQRREELRRALVFQEAVVSNMGEGLYTVNGDGCVTSMNLAAEKLFGWTSEELLGRKMHDMTHYQHRDGSPFPAEDCAGLQVLRSGIAVTNHQDVFVRKDGSCFDVVYSSSPIGASGEIAGLVVVFRDVSEQKRVEEALRDRDRALTIANDELTQQSEALSEVNNELQSFTYSVSHDLRAPLRTIDAFVRIVEEDHASRLNAEARRCLSIVKKAAGQAGELIDDLLEFSRLGRIGMDMRSVRMGELATEVANELQAMQEGRVIDLRILELPPCRGDWRLLKLVWTNLLTNAFKYTRPRPVAQIEIGWLPDDRQPDAAVYYVKDNGVGFDMKYVHKLFGVFQRLHLKEEFEGTGVGLAIVHRILRRHGGRVWAEGKLDGGATFLFSLRKALQ